MERRERLGGKERGRGDVVWLLPFFFSFGACIRLEVFAWYQISLEKEGVFFEGRDAEMSSFLKVEFGNSIRG